MSEEFEIDIEEDIKKQVSEYLNGFSTQPGTKQNAYTQLQEKMASYNEADTPSHWKKLLARYSVDAPDYSKALLYLFNCIEETGNSVGLLYGAWTQLVMGLEGLDSLSAFGPADNTLENRRIAGVEVSMEISNAMNTLNESLRLNLPKLVLDEEI
jgi:hypothetical protein